MTAANLSFNGHGWLVVINLALITGGTLVCAQVAGRMSYHLWKERGARRPLVALLRALMLIAFGGMTVRTGVEAFALWAGTGAIRCRPGCTCS